MYNNMWLIFNNHNWSVCDKFEQFWMVEIISTYIFLVYNEHFTKTYITVKSISKYLPVV